MIEGESKIERVGEREREREGERPGIIIFVFLRLSLIILLTMFFACLDAPRFAIVRVCVTCPERFLLTAVAYCSSFFCYRSRRHRRRWLLCSSFIALLDIRECGRRWFLCSSCCCCPSISSLPKSGE
jgi:hypothetical protein